MEDICNMYNIMCIRYITEYFILILDVIITLVKCVIIVKCTIFCLMIFFVAFINYQSCISQQHACFPLLHLCKKINPINKAKQ